jgi:hypothetical protein
MVQESQYPKILMKREKSKCSVCDEMSCKVKVSGIYLLQKAIERSLPIMTQDWVRSVWEASCKRNVHASDPEFQAYKCPVFYGLTITCSNLPRQQKEELRKLIQDNGESNGEQYTVDCLAYRI